MSDPLSAEPQAAWLGLWDMFNSPFTVGIPLLSSERQLDFFSCLWLLYKFSGIRAPSHFSDLRSFVFIHSRVVIVQKSVIVELTRGFKSF